MYGDHKGVAALVQTPAGQAAGRGRGFELSVKQPICAPCSSFTMPLNKRDNQDITRGKPCHVWTAHLTVVDTSPVQRARLEPPSCSQQVSQCKPVNGGFCSSPSFKNQTTACAFVHQLFLFLARGRQEERQGQETSPHFSRHTDRPKKN